MAEREESRYAHLLAPIRDLSQNWHTDIAAELSDYLSQLEEVTFSFDGGTTALNFAEAALLIQGSTCVYSRKVEYLHKLVYNALEAVANKRRAAADADAADGAAELELDDEDDVAAFLALDDVLQEGQGIDLDEDVAARCAVTPRAPDAAFWALCDAHAGAEGEGGQYKIASCAVHFTGALLLDPRDAELLDEHLQYREPEAVAPAEPGAAPAADAAGDAGGFDDAAAAGGGWSDDDGAMADVPADTAADVAAGMALRARGAGGVPGPAAAADEDDEEDDFDPWEPLDYSDANGLPVKPFRKGRTQRREAAASGAVAAAEARAASEARHAARLGAIFPEFAYAYEQRAKLRKRERVAATRAAAAHGAAPAAALQPLDEDDYDDCGDTGAYAGGWSDDDAPPLDAGALEAAAAEGHALPSWGAPPPAQLPAEGEEPSYEDLVRAHIDSYLAAAAAAEGQTELAARVASWKSKIEPALLDQESRPAFDIHTCGAEVLTALQAVAPEPATPDAPAPPVRFQELMADRPVFEVARSFAAMLQLVNAGNLDIVPSTDDAGAAAAFAVQLLSTSGAQSALEAYRAPSLEDKGEKPVAKPAAKGGAKGGDKAAPAPKRRAALAAGTAA